MTSKEFVIWLKGFTEGVHDFNVTPKQWDLLKDRLAQVEECDELIETPGMFQVHQPPPPGTLVQRYPWAGQPIPCSGSVSIPSVWTSTATGSIINYTITSGSAWSGATSGLVYTYPNGTTVTYSNGDINDSWNIKNKDLLHD